MMRELNKFAGICCMFDMRHIKCLHILFIINSCAKLISIQTFFVFNFSKRANDDDLMLATYFPNDKSADYRNYF